MDRSAPITVLLDAWKSGDQSALDTLVPLVYKELRRMASACLRKEPGGQTLEPTALVHEAYLRLAHGGSADCANRAHFFGVASRVMRQILVDNARSKNAAKRKGARVPLDEDLVFTAPQAALVVALDDALDELEKQDPEKARILELKYFGGMTAEDSALLLGLPVHTVNRQMRLAQAWLRRELEERPAAAKETAKSKGEIRIQR